MPVTLRHAAVVDHEEVDLKIFCACPRDGVVLGPNELDHLDDQVLYLHKLQNRLEVLKIKGNKFKE